MWSWSVAVLTKGNPKAIIVWALEPKDRGSSPSSAGSGQESLRQVTEPAEPLFAPLSMGIQTPALHSWEDKQAYVKSLA